MSNAKALRGQLQFDSMIHRVGVVLLELDEWPELVAKRLDVFPHAKNVGALSLECKIDENSQMRDIAVVKPLIMHL